MAVRVRNVAFWDSATPATRAAITACLATPAPMLVWCGPEDSLIYNDAAIAMLGDAHPAALGRTLPDEQNERWRSLRSDLDRVRRERSVIRTAEFSLTPIIDAGQIVAILGVPSASTAAELPAELPILGDVDDAPRANVLVVEPDRDMREFLTRSLASTCNVIEATDATQALALAASEAPDLIISDVRMPGLDGIALVQALRDAPRTVHVPVILQTAEREGETRERGLAAGAHDYLIKPFTGAELVSRVRLQIALARIRAEEMRKATRAKDDFLSMVGHELRNPLSTVSTMLQALLLRGPTHEVELMERAVRQLTRLVEDLLESSRLSRGKVSLNKRVTELAQIVDRAIEHVSPLLNERRNKVVVSVPRVGFRVDADGERLARAIANVLTNAAQHTPAGRRIAIDAGRDGEDVRLRIVDEGTGIAPGRIGTVFEAFQAERTEGGLGLGLTIARSVIELHGGSIVVTSPGAGQGTECTIELPATVQEAVEPQPTMSHASRRRLLLVEDNDDAGRALKAALEQLGYEVALAHDAPIALNLARTFKPDVALLDLGLPVMDGWELAKRLHSAGDSLPVVAVTARDQETDKQRSAELGFADHLVKPIDLPQLQRIVEELTASRVGS